MRGGSGKIKETGIVTVFEECLPKGVIDGTYFFSKEIAGPQIRKGSKVDFSARLSHETFQWEVTEIKLHISTEDTERTQHRKFVTIVGIVSHINTEFAIVKYGKNQGEEQHVPVNCLPQDYQVLQGDYVRIKFELNNPNDENAGGKILTVEPTKTKTIVGRVMLFEGQISIENYIYFDTIGFLKRRFPKLNDIVCVVAIESQQLHYAWRAISIRPSNFQSYTGAEKESEWWLNRDNCSSKDLTELLSNKDNVRIQPEKYIHFAQVKIGSTATRTLDIRNNGYSKAILKNIIIKGDQSVCKFRVDTSQREEEGIIATVEPNAVHTLTISCHPEMLGSTRELIIFDFNDFRIGRYLTVTALSTEVEILDELKGKESGQRDFRNIKNDGTISRFVNDRLCQLVRGVPPIRSSFFVQKRVASFTVPKYLWSILEKEDEEDLLKRHPAINEELRIQNYLDTFRLTLWLEEMENEILRRQYDIDQVILRRAGPYFTFEVPGIKDFHPPIQIGDPLSVYNAIANTSRVAYEAFIFDIRGNDVYTKFNEEFNKKYSGSAVTVQFRVGRSTYRRCHHAIEQAIRYLGEDWLFPDENIECKPPRIVYIEKEEEDPEVEDGIKEFAKLELCSNSKDQNSNSNGIFRLNLFGKHATRHLALNKVSYVPDKIFGAQQRTVDRRIPSIKTFESNTRGPSSEPNTLKWFNKMLNREQKDAVRRILRAQSRPLPYIIFGPPGTGKTVTIVEAILQVYVLDKNSRTLVVAPSNSAADVIAQNLVASKQFGIGDFVRLVGFLRLDIQIPESIRNYCSDGEHLDMVARNRLIVCTCTTAGQFFQLGLDTGHFTHVFIDEAGYCTEPEAIIAASLVAFDKAGQVILAGDPKQLGPVLMSDVASKCGLSLSFLERLMKRPLYSRNEKKFPIEKYNPIVLTKLVKNYRAHLTLLKLPSKLFYDDELVAAAAEEDTNLYHSLDFLRQRGTPLLFHGIRGISEREMDSPSWYNSAEVIQVVEYVRRLMAQDVSVADIGIITPYRKQVEKLRRALELGLLSNVVPKVGSVEEFQGGERKVVIMSLVRSVRDKDMEKVVDRLNFVFSPKRFNVAITRAKAVLIVIGNPHILIYDEIWQSLIKYCIELGAYTGCDLPAELDTPIETYLIEKEKAMLKEETMSTDKKRLVGYDADWDEDCD